MKPTLEEIHENLVNGNRRDMVKQIKKYGLYDFWADYREYLAELYLETSDQYGYFADACNSYFKITNK